jgi:hypothetical protein
MHSIARATVRTACCAAMRTLPVRRSVPKIAAAAAAAASAANSRFDSLVTPLSSKQGIQGDFKYLDSMACYKEEELDDLNFELLEFDFDLDEPELSTLTEALTRSTKADGLEEDALEAESVSPEPNQPREEAVNIPRVGLETEAAHELAAESESDLESALIKT